MKVFGKNVFNELKDNVKSIKKVYIAKNFNDKEIIKFIQDNKISYSVTDPKNMDGMVEGRHQGIIAIIDDYEYVDYKTMLGDNVVVMLDHLEDPHNFGAIIRTCEALGIDAIIIPNDRNVNINGTVVKTSVGAIYNMPIVRVVNLNNTIEKLKDIGYWIIGTDMVGTDYTKIDYNMPVCLVIGNEGKGISKIIKNNCDFMATIPMSGNINSLNASVSCGIVLSRIVSSRN